MITARLLRLASVGAAVSITAGLAPAQLAGKFVVTPYVGAYSPTTDVFRDNFTAGTTTASINARHQTALATGLNASYWITDRFALEAGTVYSNGDVKGRSFINEGGQVVSTPLSDHAHVWAGSAKLMMQLLPPDAGLNLRLGVGPAFITRGGSAYSGTDGKITGLTDFGGALSLCTRLAMTDALGLRLRAEDYVYRTKLRFESSGPDVGNLQFGARTQHDFVFSLGIQMLVTP